MLVVNPSGAGTHFSTMWRRSPTWFFRQRFGGNSLVTILSHYLTTSGCHPRSQFHELHPQVLQGVLVVGDLTLDIRQLEFK